MIHLIDEHFLIRFISALMMVAVAVSIQISGAFPPGDYILVVICVLAFFLSLPEVISIALLGVLATSYTPHIATTSNFIFMGAPLWMYGSRKIPFVSPLFRCVAGSVVVAVLFNLFIVGPGAIISSGYFFAEVFIIDMLIAFAGYTIFAYRYAIQK